MASGVAVVVVVLASLDVFLYVNLRASLMGNLEEVLETRSRLVRAETAGLEPAEAAEVLGRLGLDAVVRGPDGTTYRAEPVWPGLGDGLPPSGRGQEHLVSRRLALADGATVDVSVRRSGVDAALRRLLVAEVAGTAAATALAALLLLRASGIALEPLSRIVAAARRTAAGHRGERLRPDRPETSLGEMAAAYDDMLDALEAALADAQAAEDRSRRFLAGAAHQLRTPIASIQMAAENLIRAGPDADVDSMAASLVHETSRSARLIAGLLEMARLDRGEPLVPAPCDLLALCRDEADRVATRAPTLEIVVEAAELPDEPSELDAHAVREIVANLLDNARRHARARVAVTVESGESRMWEVRVADDGPGLPEGSEERVFERFVSLDGKGGSGLGLAIARDLARAHGGDLAYEGSAFVLRLPAASAGVFGALPSASVSDGPADPELQPLPSPVGAPAAPAQPARPAPRR